MGIRSYLSQRSLRGSLARRGARGTAALLAVDGLHVAQRTAAFASETGFDWWHGVNTRGRVWQHALGVEPAVAAQAEYYQGASPVALRGFITSLGIEYRRYCFVDLGSGKGKALLLAREFPFARLVGVELSPRLNAIASRNVARARRFAIRGGTVTVTTGSADDHVFGPEPVVLYLNNPFGPSVMTRVRAALEKVVAHAPLPCFVIYHGPRHRALFDAAPWLTVVSTPPDCVIYRSTAASAQA